MKPQKLLARQLKRHLGLADDAAVAAYLDGLEQLAAQQPPAVARGLRGLRALLVQVDEAYAQYDRDLTLGSRSLAISSQELLEANERIREEARAQQRVLAALRTAVQRLARGAGVTEVHDDDIDLEDLSSRLSQLVAEHAAAKARLQMSEERLNLALTATGNWIWDWERARDVVHVISNGSGILGYPLSFFDPPGRAWREVIVPGDRPLLARALLKHLRGAATAIDVTVRVLTIQREERAVRILGKIVARDTSGRPRRIAGTVSDVTERNRIQEALLRAKEAADAANAAKSLFLANMSHEIRTPMNGLLGVSELLLEDALTPAQRDKVKLIYSAGRTLLGILNDILDFSKIEAGRMEIERVRFDLRELIERVARLHAPPAREKKLRLEIAHDADLPAQCIGDPLRVQQVLNNLLGNAIKFTAHGHVTLRVRRSDPPELRGDIEVGGPHTPQRVRVRCEVEDTGIGLAPDVIARLFQPFAQADASTTRRFGGTGLGLAISKNIVELLGGTIGVESTEGVGSLFWFELPLLLATEVKPVAVPAPAPAGHNPQLHGRRVLVVEDNALNLLVVNSMLELMGVDITAVAHGAEALDALRRRRFDLVLMDCQMPVMDGFEAARNWRAEEAAQALTRTPVVALTANVMAADRERCLASGFDDHLGKPFTRAQLERLLVRWLKPHASAPTSVRGNAISSAQSKSD
jgi:signal transduction histidine kinase/CheY-like chemotaxis protein